MITALRRRFEQSLRWKLTVFVAGMVGLTVGLLSVAGYGFTARILRRQIYDRLSVVQTDRQKMLLNHVRHQLELIQLQAQRASLVEPLTEYASARMTEAAFRLASQRSLEELLKTSRSFEALWVANATGLVVTATAENFLWKNLAIQPEFQMGLTNSHMGVISLTEDRYRVVAVAPVRRKDGALLGVLMALVDADEIVRAVADVTGLGETGEVLVGRRVGDRIRYLVPSRFQKDLTETPAAAMPALSAATRGEKGFMRTRDYRGCEVLAAYGPVGYRDWGLVAKMNWTEAYRPVLWLRWSALAALVVMLTAGIGSAYELARRFTRPILEMAHMAEAIAAGAMDTRLQVRRKDEVGRLADSFNRMAEQLAQSYAALEERVRQRTAALEAERHLLQSLMDHIPDHIYFKDRESRFLRVNRAMAHWIGVASPEEAVGKTDADIFSAEHAQSARADEQHVMTTGQPIISKEEKETWPDGRVTWVSTTKVPFRDEQGNIVGTFGISRDITQRKAAEQQLALYARALEEKNRQIEEDLILAREVQLALLPQRYPTFPSGSRPEESALEFCHHYQPTSTLGGDFFEVVVLSDTQAGIFIGDVMGHGVRSALVMAVLRGLVDELQTFGRDPSRFLAEINRALVAHRVSASPVFVTALYMVVEAADGSVHCASAGHPSPLWIRRNLNRVQPLVVGAPRSGPVLGLVADAEFPSIRYTLELNDVVVLYTDGLCEVQNTQNDPYGTERAQAFLQAHLQLPCDQLLKALVADARTHAARGEFEDDVCLVAVRFARRLRESQK